MINMALLTQEPSLRSLIFFSLSLLLAVNSFAFENLLQSKPRDIRFETVVRELDLKSPNVTLAYKMGTTSVGLKIIKDGKYLAYWYPEGNVSAVPEGQVVTYTLARFLHMSELVAPSDYFDVSGPALKTLMDFLENDNADGDDPWKQKSIADVLASARRHFSEDTALTGAITKKMDNFEPYALVDWQHNRFNSEHPIAKMIRANEPQPSSIRILDLPDFVAESGEVNTSTEEKLASDLSQIMVLDMLSGQQDRFSGGNLEARFDKSEDDPLVGHLRFLIRDNGQAEFVNGGPEGTEFKKYLTIVTRFDRKQIQRVALLSSLIEKSPEEIRETLKMKSEIGLLKVRADAVLRHVDEQIRLYGEDQVFFRK